MKVDAKKNKMLVPLLAAVLIIWGLIIYNIIERLYLDDENVTESIAEPEFYKPTKKRNRENYRLLNLSYTKLKRDPFVLKPVPKITPEQQAAAVQKEKQAKPALSYKINGVIVNDKSRLVLFEDLSDKSTHFLRKGDEYKTIKIISISDILVTLTEDGKKKEIEIK